MALLSIHRIEIRGTDPRAFPRVPRASFDEWHRSAISAKSVAINSCFLKFALNNVWFYVLRGHVPFTVLRAGGLLVFFGWLLVFGYSFVLSSRASKRARDLGIVPGRKIIESNPRDPDAPVEAPVTETKEAGEASSR